MSRISKALIYGAHIVAGTLLIEVDYVPTGVIVLIFGYHFLFHWSRERALRSIGDELLKLRTILEERRRREVDILLKIEGLRAHLREARR